MQLMIMVCGTIKPLMQAVGIREFYLNLKDGVAYCSEKLHVNFVMGKLYCDISLFFLLRLTLLNVLMLQRTMKGIKRG